LPIQCAAGALDPSANASPHLTIPAAFGRIIGADVADNLMPRTPAELKLVVHRQSAWWIAASLLGSSYIVALGRGIQFVH